MGSINEILNDEFEARFIRENIRCMYRIISFNIPRIIDQGVVGSTNSDAKEFTVDHYVGYIKHRIN